MILAKEHISNGDKPMLLNGGPVPDAPPLYVAAPSAPASPASHHLSGLEAEAIGLFVQLARLVGLSRSVAELYGLLFVAVRPMSMEEIRKRTGASKGSASMGLRFLLKAGAVRAVYVPGHRAMQYEALAELRNVGVHLLHDQIVPTLDSGLGRLERLATLVEALPPEERARVAPRVAMLQGWEKKTRRFLPLMLRLMGGQSLEFEGDEG